MRVLAGEFQKIYDPSLGEEHPWYINDHTIIQAEDGWHLFGITHEEPANPLEEKHCAHAFSPDLLHVPFQKRPFPFSSDEAFGEAHFWAPHIISHEGTYYMFYCGGSLRGNDSYRIHLATSEDLLHWQRAETNPLVIDGFDARDPMVIRYGERWIMYYTCTSKPKGGYHCVAAVESDDLRHWGKKRVVFMDYEKGTFGGPCESPFVTKAGDWYFLSVSLRGGYIGTDFFASKDPMDFSEKKLVGHVPSHAAEIIEAGGEHYITHCGWGQGGVYLAKLEFQL